VNGSKKRVVVVGQGYVGLPLAMRAVEVGHTVIGFDTSEERIKRLASGESYVQDVSDAVVRSSLDCGRFQPTLDPDDCMGFDVAVITVPTPLLQGAPDLSHIEEASETLATMLSAGATVILESTTYPGTTEDFILPILENGSGLVAGRQFHLGYSPERIDPGNPEFVLVNTPKVVSGIDAASCVVIDDFYADLVDRTVPVSSPRVAELTKLLENTFRHVNIALVNELAMYASALGVSVWEAIDAASTKPFGYMRFTPGPGVGGHCLPVDPSYLSWKVKQSVGDAFRFVELANDVNDHMPTYVTRRIMEALNRQRRAINGSRILVLGLAYKKNTGDLRQSPSLGICAALSDRGADVRVVDSFVPARQAVAWPRVDLTDQELESADLVVVVTDHDDVDYDRVGARARFVFDTRRRVRPGPTVEYL
jgi:UDP-N-acetyl-D-glucosamine dehydrogenase